MSPRSPSYTAAKGQHWRIIDPELLASALEGEIQEQFDGVLAKAARKWDLPERTLRRLVQPRFGSRRAALWARRSIREGVYRKLRRVLKRDRDFWRRVVLEPDALPRFAIYHAWIRETRRRIVAETYLDRAVSNVLPPQDSDYRSEQRDVLWALIAAYRPHVRNEIEQLALKHTAERLELAIDRIVEPLLDARRSGFVELDWRELSREKFDQFIDCGWTRERLLLERDDDLRRVAKRRRPILEAMTGAPRTVRRPWWRTRSLTMS